MEILDKIRELEVKANKAEVYKRQLEEFKRKLKECLIPLNQLITDTEIKLYTKKRGEHSVRSTEIKIIDKLYDDLLSNDTLEIDTEYIMNAMREFNLKLSKPDASRIRQSLLERKGVTVRREGRNMKIFYVKTSNDVDEEKKKLMEMFPKKMSFMK